MLWLRHSGKPGFTEDLTKKRIKVGLRCHILCPHGCFIYSSATDTAEGL